MSKIIGDERIQTVKYILFGNFGPDPRYQITIVPLRIYYFKTLLISLAL